MALLDGDRCEGRFRAGVHTADVSDLMRRMMKETLLSAQVASRAATDSVIVSSARLLDRQGSADQANGTWRARPARDLTAVMLLTPRAALST